MPLIASQMKEVRMFYKKIIIFIIPLFLTTADASTCEKDFIGQKPLKVTIPMYNIVQLIRRSGEGR